MNTSISSPSNAKGSCLEWIGERSGSGRIENLYVKPQERIDQRMKCKQPFRVEGRSQWTFIERDGKTEVSWQFRGRVAFTLRAFAQTVQSMFFLDYKYALDRLASLVEPAQASRYRIQFLGLKEIPASRFVYINYSGPIAGLRASMHNNLVELRQSYQLVDGEIPSIAIYMRTNIKLRTTICRMGIPIGDCDERQSLVHEMPAHLAYVVRLQGGYAALEIAWYQAMQRMRVEGILPDQRIPPFERYLNEPGNTLENDLITEVHVPVLSKPKFVDEKLSDRLKDAS